MTKKMILGLPIQIPLLFPQGLFKLHEESLSEICSASKRIQFDMWAQEKVIPEISLFESPELHPLINRFWIPNKSIRKYRLLTFAINSQSCIDKMLSNYDWSKISLNEEEKKRIVIEDVAMNLEFEVNNLLLLANLLNPGTISAEKGYVIFNGQLVAETSPFYAEHLHFAVEAARSINWPVFHEVSLIHAWSWLTSSKCIRDGMSIGSLGRAWAAFSHITTDSFNKSSSIDLVWILLGLEALFCKDIHNRKKQIQENTEILLGKRNEYKDAFGTIYTFRSKLLHGSENVPLRYSNYDAVKESEKYQDQLHKHGSLTLAVLIATLQLMAKKKWVELQFKYSLSVSGQKINSKRQKSNGDAN